MEHISNKFLQGLLEKLAIYINKLYKEFGLDDKIEDKSHAEFCKYFNYERLKLISIGLKSMQGL